MRIISITSLFLLILLPLQAGDALAQTYYTSQSEMVKKLLARGVKNVTTVRQMPLSAKKLASELGYGESAKFIGEMHTESKTVGVPQLRSFVYHWFSWIDRKAPLALFKVHLSRISLFISFQGKEIRGSAGFENWYADFCRKFVNTHHEVEKVGVEAEKTGGFFLELDVKRRAVTSTGAIVKTKEKQSWYVRVGSDKVIRIRRIVAQVVEVTNS